MDEMTAEEYRRTRGTRGAGRSKYGAKVTYVSGIRFASRLEAQKYEELLLLERGGFISGLRVHPRYEIVAKSQHGRALYYEGDFAFEEGGREVVMDTKGGRNGKATSTPVFRLKARLFRERYPHIELRIEWR